MGSTKSTNLVAAGALALLLAGPSGAAEGVGEVALDVGRLRNTRGEVVIAVFRSPEGFPDGQYAFRAASIPAEARSVSRRFPALPPGEYAILVIHDEDRDGALDTGLFGIPTEGYGASRNDLPTFSAPSFAGNRFVVEAGKVTSVQIRLRYL